MSSSRSGVGLPEPLPTRKKAGIDIVGGQTLATTDVDNERLNPAKFRSNGHQGYVRGDEGYW